MKNKNILIFIDWFLPGTQSGGPVRSYANLIAHLGRDFNFFIITRDSDYCSTDVYGNVVSNSWNNYDGNTQVYYLSKDKINAYNIKSIVSDLDVDMIYINGIYSWYYSVLPLVLFGKKYRTIISARGMLNPQAFSVKGFKKKVFLTIARMSGIYNKVIFHATNDQEMLHIKDVIGSFVKVRVAPNLPRPLIQIFQEKDESEVTKFANVARISIEKGTLKMIKAFNSVKSNVNLDIYGPIYDESYWNRCLDAIRLLPHNVTVNYKGSVESDLIPAILNDYDFFILLSEGENFGHAILEGLSAGCPVIISKKTPWQNLEQKGIGWDLDIDNDNEITTVLNKASIMSNSKYKTMSRCAFDYAKNFCEDPDLIEQNKRLFNDF